MKLIFLDFDGVLNSHAWMAGEVYKNKPSLYADRLAWHLGKIDPAAVLRVSRIVQETDARIVISSAWRSSSHHCGSTAYLGALLARHGLQEHRKRVIGITPDVTDRRPGKPPIQIVGSDRWSEIRMYLDGAPECDRFVVIDDDPVIGTPAENFVRTDYTVGLTDVDAEKAIAILHGEAI
ncbi:MAG: HAD domain-containing protein [Capsulimonas sp.]|uniref:HAD domain-containing protein n=1 Tax=Capsulimonas sp. TaxID=2494211 RepID=UPI003265E2AA